MVTWQAEEETGNHGSQEANEMKLIDKLRKQLESIGASLDANDYTLNCDAPSGYVWSANGETNFAIHYATNSETWLAQALREEMPNLRMGLDKVVDQDDLQSIRHNLGDDTWVASADAPEHIDWPK